MFTFSNAESFKFEITGQDSIDQYSKGNREDLASKEKLELHILEKFLPEAIPEDELRNIIDGVIKECNATNMKDMGKIMGIIISKTSGRADGSIISQIVKDKLS